jgi:hypothetical protein
MNVFIQINFISCDSKILQQGSFPLRGRKREEVAFEFWKQIRRYMPYGGELARVRADGEDITELVKKLDEAPID